MKARQFFMGMTFACALAVTGPAHAHEMQGGMHHHMMGKGCCDQALPPEKAKLVEGSMHQMMKKNEAAMEHMHALHEKMEAISTADKFDKKAFLATGDEMAALHMKMEKDRTRMMASVAAQLTAQERRDMKKCMEENFHRGEFGHGGWHHDGESHEDHAEGRMERPMESSHKDTGSYNQ